MAAGIDEPDLEGTCMVENSDSAVLGSVEDDFNSRGTDGIIDAGRMEWVEWVAGCMVFGALRT